MVIGIDPLVGLVCKKLLGSPEPPAISLRFLNAILGGKPRIIGSSRFVSADEAIGVSQSDPEWRGLKERNTCVDTIQSNPAGLPSGSLGFSLLHKGLGDDAVY
jgi:hypothetical protein